MAEVRKKAIVTARDDGMTRPTIGHTPDGMPDIRVTPMPWWGRLIIRGAKTYLSSLVAFLGAGSLGVLVPDNPVPLTGFMNSLWIAMQLALVPAIGTIILNASILITKLDESQPELMA